MKDPIEREDAINALWSLDVEIGVILNRLKGLPSAQPDLNQWCTDCKEYDKEKHCCPRFNRVIRETLKDAELEPYEDAVSRKDAIRWVKTECNPYGKPTLDFESGKKVIEYLTCPHNHRNKEDET